MLRRLIGLAVLGGAVFTARAADDAITIKDYVAKPGERVKVTTETKSTTKITATAGGQSKEQLDEKTEKLVYVEEVIDRPAGAKQPTKLKRTYETAEAAAGGKTTKYPFAGKTVVIEKAGDKFGYTYDGGGAVEKNGAAVLDREFNRPDGISGAEGLLPTKPVKPGDTWAVDKDVLAKALGSEGIEIDKAKTTATGKLVKAYQKDGKQFGVVELAFVIPITKLGPKLPIELKAGAKSEIAMTADACLDGTDPAGKTVTKSKTRFGGSAMGADITFDVDEMKTKTEELLPKK